MSDNLYRKDANQMFFCAIKEDVINYFFIVETLPCVMIVSSTNMSLLAALSESKNGRTSASHKILRPFHFSRVNTGKEEHANHIALQEDLVLLF